MHNAYHEYLSKSFKLCKQVIYLSKYSFCLSILSISLIEKELKGINDFRESP